MNNKRVLSIGKHTAKVARFIKGVSEHKKTPYFSLIFENDNGYIEQRFYINEWGRIKLQALFKEFGVEPKFYDDASIESCLNSLLDKEIYFEVIKNIAGNLESLGWKRPR